MLFRNSELGVTSMQYSNADGILSPPLNKKTSNARFKRKKNEFWIWFFRILRAIDFCSVLALQKHARIKNTAWIKPKIAILKRHRRFKKPFSKCCCFFNLEMVFDLIFFIFEGGYADRVVISDSKWFFAKAVPCFHNGVRKSGVVSNTHWTDNFLFPWSSVACKQCTDADVTWIVMGKWMANNTETQQVCLHDTSFLKGLLPIIIEIFHTVYSNA